MTKCAKALLASAIRWVFSLFGGEAFVFGSGDKLVSQFLDILAPFLVRAPSKSHLNAKS